MKTKRLIIFDGEAWFERRVRVIEHDLTRDEKVYRCSKHLGGPYKKLSHVPSVRKEIDVVQRRLNKLIARRHEEDPGCP